MIKYLTYQHPAVAPLGIELNKVYSLEELQKRFSAEEIKCFFVSADLNVGETEEKPVIKITKL